jgi:hypothetical protein
MDESPASTPSTFPTACRRCERTGAHCVRQTRGSLVCKPCREAKVRCERDDVEVALPTKKVRLAAPSLESRKEAYVEIDEGRGRWGSSVREGLDALAAASRRRNELLEEQTRALKRQTRVMRGQSLLLGRLLEAFGAHVAQPTHRARRRPLFLGDGSDQDGEGEVEQEERNDGDDEDDEEGMGDEDPATSTPGAGSSKM